MSSFGKIVIFEQSNEYKIQTSFDLNGLSGVFNCLESALHSLDIYPDKYSERDFLISKECGINKNELKNVLIRWKFEVSFGQALLEIKQIEKKKPVIEEKSKFFLNRKSELPTIIALDLKNYIKEGRLFKGKEQIIEGAKWYEITVSSTLNKLMAVYDKSKLKDANVIPIKQFLSEYEIINRLLPKLPEEFKGKKIIDFLSTRRNDCIIDIYKSLFRIDKEKSVGELLSNGFTFVDANRVYELIYKFGTQNRKAYYIYKDWYVMKPYKWDFVVIINIGYLNSLRDNEIIYFTYYKGFI